MASIVMILVWVLVLSLFATELVRRYAKAHLLDIPNERSAHCLPTPRGGGLAFVLVFSAYVVYAILYNGISTSLGYAVLGTGLSVAVVGFIDDHWSISARARLLMHALALSWGMYCLGALPQMAIVTDMMIPGVLLQAVVLLAMVWLLNLYNFMDGINGLAAMQAVVFCFAAASLFYLDGAPTEALLLCVLAVSVAGFLCFNFPRALIFMGDVGSGFLGAVFALFFFRALQINMLLFVSLLILLAVFIVDANLTLIRRAYRGEAIMQAHSTHAYQHASRLYGHSRVTWACTLITLAFLYPLAICVNQGYIGLFFGLLMAYLPLMGLASFCVRHSQNKTAF